MKEAFQSLVCSKELNWEPVMEKTPFNVKISCKNGNIYCILLSYLVVGLVSETKNVMQTNYVLK